MTIIIRTTFTKSPDAPKARDLLVEWRDAHPDVRWRIGNGITGGDHVTVWDQLFDDEDYAEVAFNLFGLDRFEVFGKQPGADEWMKKWQSLDTRFDKRELWREID